MKATDMMIGDWVYVYEALADNLVNKVAIRVESISPGLAFVGCGGRYCDYDYAEPIPLTEEILKANGFDDEMELYINDNCVLEYDLFFNHLKAYYLVSGDKVKYMDIFFMYVHELQHALRICGLNDLAENFKVE